MYFSSPKSSMSLTQQQRGGNISVSLCVSVLKCIDLVCPRKMTGGQSCFCGSFRKAGVFFPRLLCANWLVVFTCIWKSKTLWLSLPAQFKVKENVANSFGKFDQHCNSISGVRLLI